MKTENAFDQMGKGAVADIMQQSCRQHGRALPGGDLIFRLKFIEDPNGQMERAEAVCKTGMLCPLVGKKADAKLTDAPQTLKFRCVNQADKQTPLGVVRAEAYDIMNRIPVYLFYVNTPSSL
jgi:hypothetical protein